MKTKNYHTSLMFGAMLFLFSFVCFPANAEITISTQTYADQSRNPFASTANIELVKKAIYLLTGDSRLSNHPIRRYLNDPSIKTKIVFDNPRLTGGTTTATASNNEIHIRSNSDFSYYLEILAHEFIHIDISEKYLNSLNYSFLSPEDSAF